MAPPAIRICVQSGFYTQPLKHGALAGSICVSGHWLRVADGETLAEVLAYSEANVTARFADFLAAVPAAADIGAQVILDLEGPIHAADWHLYDGDPPTQDAIIAAWMMRVAVARAALPDAELGAYGTLIPDNRGDPTDATYQARLAALQAAHSGVGAFDDLDVWVPVLYPRFGPLDGKTNWNSYGAYTALGIDGSRLIGPAKPVKPLLHYRIKNGASAHDEVQLLDLETPNPLKRSWDVQLATLEAKAVTEGVLWISGVDSEFIPGSARSIYQYISPARPVVHYR